ncbi:hypothetical protein, partial [Sphingobacterium sp. UBA6317]
QLVIGGGFILCSVICIGGLLEHEDWVFPLEMLRLFLLLLYIGLTFYSPLGLVLVGCFALIQLIFYRPLAVRYKKVLRIERR